MPRVLTPTLRRLDKAISKAFKKSSSDPAEQGIVTSWVLITEHMGIDGVRYLGVFADPMATPWQVTGLIEYAVPLIPDAFAYDDYDDGDDIQ